MRRTAWQRNGALLSPREVYEPVNGYIHHHGYLCRFDIWPDITSQIFVCECVFKDLKKPFVRGEKSRSNLGGNGLGLSIAERAAALNGFKLNISCANTEFSAEIKYWTLSKMDLIAELYKKAANISAWYYLLIFIHFDFTTVLRFFCSYNIHKSSFSSSKTGAKQDSIKI